MKATITIITITITILLARQTEVFRGPGEQNPRAKTRCVRTRLCAGT